MAANLDVGPAVCAGDASASRLATWFQDPDVAGTIDAALHMPLRHLSQGLSHLGLQTFRDGPCMPCTYTHALLLLPQAAVLT